MKEGWIKITFSIFKLLVCCQLSLVSGLFFLSKVFADSDNIFIDPSDPTVIRRTIVPYESQIILKASDLPAQSALHQRVDFGEQVFTHIVLSPDNNSLAFSAQGALHGWNGIYNLKDKSIVQLTLRFESKALLPYWSHDGRYLAVEEEDSNKTRFFEIFDLEGGGQCTLNGRVAKNKFLSFLHPWWSREEDKIYFRVDVNDAYRKSLGLKPLKIGSRIGEANIHCQDVVLRSVAKFMAEVPSDPLPKDAMARVPPDTSSE